MTEQHRCMTNEGEREECILAADTREDLNEMVRKAEERGGIKTKRFFKFKSD